MQEIYAALLIHTSGGQVTEDKLKEVLKASGAKVDEGKIKALVASLENVNIDDVLKQATVVSAAPTKEEKKEQKKEEEVEKRAEEAVAGLSALFG